MAAEVLSGIGIILVLIFSRSVTTLIHELGHAIPSLIFTSQEVNLYVGSYGNISHSKIIKFGRLTIFFRLRILELHLGLCSHYPTSSILKELMIVFGGPLFSLLLGLVCLAAIYDYPSNSFLTVTLGILMVSGIIDFFTNIIPDKNPLQLHDGRVSYNDGYQFMRLLRMFKYPKSYFIAMDYLAKEDINAGVEELEKTIEGGVRDIEIYKIVIHELIAAGQIQQALDFHERWGTLFKLDSYDYQIMGDLNLKIQKPLLALQDYSMAIEKNYLNSAALFSRGKIYLELGYNEKAKEDLKKVVLMQESNMEARGLFEKLNRTN